MTHRQWIVPVVYTFFVLVGIYFWYYRSLSVIDTKGELTVYAQYRRRWSAPFTQRIDVHSQYARWSFYPFRPITLASTDGKSHRVVPQGYHWIDSVLVLDLVSGASLVFTPQENDLLISFNSNHPHQIAIVPWTGYTAMALPQNSDEQQYLPAAQRITLSSKEIVFPAARHVRLTAQGWHQDDSMGKKRSLQEWLDDKTIQSRLAASFDQAHKSLASQIKQWQQDNGANKVLSQGIVTVLQNYQALEKRYQKTITDAIDQWDENLWLLQDLPDWLIEHGQTALRRKILANITANSSDFVHLVGRLDFLLKDLHVQRYPSESNRKIIQSQLDYLCSLLVWQGNHLLLSDKQWVYPWASFWLGSILINITATDSPDWAQYQTIGQGLVTSALAFANTQGSLPYQSGLGHDDARLADMHHIAQVWTGYSTHLQVQNLQSLLGSNWSVLSTWGRVTAAKRINEVTTQLTWQPADNDTDVILLSLPQSVQDIFVQDKKLVKSTTGTLLTDQWLTDSKTKLVAISVPNGANAVTLRIITEKPPVAVPTAIVSDKVTNTMVPVPDAPAPSAPPPAPTEKKKKNKNKKE